MKKLGILVIVTGILLTPLTSTVSDDSITANVRDLAKVIVDLNHTPSTNDKVILKRLINS